jgi:uncharacterized protein YndB with AHSA1/START domain
MGVVQHSIWIGAAPSTVWDLYTDLDRMSEWQTGDPRVLAIDGCGDQVGTTYAVRRGPGAARTTVTEAVRPSLHGSRTNAYLGLSFDLTARLLPEQGGTRLLLEAQTHWPRGIGLLGRVAEFVFLNGGEADRELERLKVLVESEAAKESPDH